MTLPGHAADGSIRYCAADPSRGTAVLIDGGYLMHVLDLEFSRLRVHLPSLCRRLAGEKPQVARYYTCLPYVSSPPRAGERERWSRDQAYFAGVQRGGVQVRLGQLVFRGFFADGAPKLAEKQTDVLLATDLAELAITRTVARVVLLTGDSDLVPAVRLAQRHGVTVCLAHGGLPATELVESCLDRVPLTESLLRTAQTRSAAVPAVPVPAA